MFMVYVCGMPVCGVYMWGELVYTVCVLCRVYGICIDMFLYVSLRVSIAVMKHQDQRMLGRNHGGVLLTGLLHMACSACLLIEPIPSVAPPTMAVPPSINH